MKLFVAIIIVVLLVIGCIVEWTRNRDRDENAMFAWLVGIIVSVFILLAALGSQYAHAHDANHPELTDWFKGLYSRKGVCCDGSDAVHIEDPDWTNDHGHYRVKLDGEWIDVPDEAVVDAPNKLGSALVWPIKGYLGTSIRCFMPGTMG